MTHTADYYATCVAQEIEYTQGWRDYARGEIVGGRTPEFRRFYAKGWTDHQTRDKCHAMYARKDER